MAEAAPGADVHDVTMPDELQADTYKKYVHDNLKGRRRHCLCPRAERSLWADRTEATASM